MIKFSAPLVAMFVILLAGWAAANEAPEVVCVEAEPVWVCSEPRDLEQGSGSVRECSWVRSIVCESVEVEAN